MSTDSEIIARSLRRPEAFADLFERHARTVNAFATYRVGGHAAEDVLSETFLVAFRRRADFDLSSDSASPWLFGIASRLIRRHRAVEAKRWREVAALKDRLGSVAPNEPRDENLAVALDRLSSEIGAERRILMERSARRARIGQLDHVGIRRRRRAGLGAELDRQHLGLDRRLGPLSACRRVHGTDLGVGGSP